MEDVNDYYDFDNYDDLIEFNELSSRVMTKQEKIDWLVNYREYLDNVSRSITEQLYELKKN